MPRTDTPPLTVFTTFYQHTSYLDETIASVLSQSYGDFEYLLLNDGEQRESDRIQRRFPDPRIRIVTQQRQGIARSRDRGLHLAQGELIAMIDGDDFCEPSRLERQVAFLRDHPDHVLVGSTIRFIDERSQTIGHRNYPEDDEAIRKVLLRFNCIAQSTVMARREALIRAGGYSVEFAWAEDYDLWLRLARLGKLHNLPDALVAYRLHEHSGKNLRLKPALRDTIRLKIHAIRRYGYHLTPGVALNIAAHTLLLPLPAPLIFALFKRFATGRH